MQWSSHPYSLPFWAKGTHTTKLKLVCNQLSLTKSEHVCLFFVLFCFFFWFLAQDFPSPLPTSLFYPCNNCWGTCSSLLHDSYLEPCRPLAWGSLLHYNIFCHRPNRLTMSPGCFYSDDPIMQWPRYEADYFHMARCSPPHFFWSTTSHRLPKLDTGELPIDPLLS